MSPAILALIVSLDLMGQTLKAQASMLDTLPPDMVIEQKIELPKEIPKTVVQMVEEAWPNDPVMIRVARCESSFKKNALGPLAERGLYQVHPVHFKTAKLMGLDLYNPKDNIAFAKYLYEKEGTRPWNSSKHCWNRG